MLNSLRAGIGLQAIFFILFFGTLLPRMNNVIGAIICLAIGLLSLFIGIKSFLHQKDAVLPTLIIGTSVIIIAFTIFAYFMGEGGYPPLILQ
ncbi:hypothetical protein [Halobacillus litoralis]|uniref:hypothetical protein n=1 Tax=Halobacillus litoralis TaxID=45668 RepID=UPI0024931268|nr:hypothetical protein [Halobacillus litoralis]